MGNEFKIWQKSRKFKQILSGIAFLFVLIGGWFWPLLGFFIPFCMVIGITIAFFKGRKWCDWLCPRGSFYDAYMSPISLKKGIPKIFKSEAFRIAILFLLMAIMMSQLVRFWPHPEKIGKFFVIMLATTTVIGVILAILFHSRSWCMICPIGSLGHWVGRGKYPLKIDSKLCTTCKLCEKVCPVGIAPYRYKKEKIEFMTDSDCLKCNLCVKACPTHALYFK